RSFMKGSLSVGRYGFVVCAIWPSKLRSPSRGAASIAAAPGGVHRARMAPNTAKNPSLTGSQSEFTELPVELCDLHGQSRVDLAHDRVEAIFAGGFTAS